MTDQPRSLTPWDLMPAVNAAREIDESMRRLQDVFDQVDDTLLRLRIELGDPNPMPRFHLFRRTKEHRND